MIRAADLAAYLAHNGIPDWLYSLSGGGDDEMIGLTRTRSEWVVYSASHGRHITLKQTEDEQEAVASFLYYLGKQAEAYGYSLPMPD